MNSDAWFFVGKKIILYWYILIEKTIMIKNIQDKKWVTEEIVISKLWEETARVRHRGDVTSEES